MTLNMLVLFDTDFLYNFFFANQSNHFKSKEIFTQYLNYDFVISRPVRYEFLTVISNKENQEKAKQAYSKLNELELEILEITPEIENLALDIFLTSDKNKMSVVDCLNLAIAQKFNCKIASFDAFYPKEFLLALPA
jgi:predicted nucleic acid-binding protein